MLSGRAVPHYNGLVEDPEGCIPLCLAALVQLTRKGLYLYSREVNSTELADLLRQDFHGQRRDLSARGVELLTPIARSLAFATGRHLRTAVKLYTAVVGSKNGEDFATVLKDIVDVDFGRALTTDRVGCCIGGGQEQLHGDAHPRRPAGTASVGAADTAAGHSAAAGKPADHRRRCRPGGHGHAARGRERAERG